MYDAITTIAITELWLWAGFWAIVFMIHLPVKMSSKIDSTIGVPEVIWRYLYALEMASDKGNIIFEIVYYIITHIVCVTHFVVIKVYTAQ